MKSMETLQRKIKSARDLQSVVKTMKALAAVSINQYEQAVESVNQYNQIIEKGLQIVLKMRPEGTGIPEAPQGNRLGAIILGSQRGMAGQFNEAIASFSQEQLAHFSKVQKDHTIVTLGERIGEQLEERGYMKAESLPFPGSLMDITSAIQNLLFIIERWRLQEGIKQVLLFYHKSTTVAAYKPSMTYLLPINPELFKGLEEKKWPSRSLPTFTMDYHQLFSSLIQQHLFVSLYKAFAESLAGENAARLASMQAAEKNIEESLDDLTSQYNRQRQSAITAELLDIVAGFEALS